MENSPNYENPCLNSTNCFYLPLGTDVHEELKPSLIDLTSKYTRRYGYKKSIRMGDIPFPRTTKDCHEGLFIGFYLRENFPLAEFKKYFPNMNFSRGICDLVVLEITSEIGYDLPGRVYEDHNGDIVTIPGKPEPGKMYLRGYIGDAAIWALGEYGFRYSGPIDN